MRELTVKIGQHRGAAIVLALGFICGAAFFLRVYYPFDSVFKEGWVNFQSTDPWYHMRHVENLVHHFPQYSDFDPYGFYPSGLRIGTAPLFDFQIGLFAWIFGVGSPSKAVV